MTAACEPPPPRPDRRAETDVTDLLRRWSTGDAGAADELLPIVYDRLRRIASRHLRRERPGHTLQTTALVHEAFLELSRQDRVGWQGRTHFYGLSARLMRRILVEHARRRGAAKRGGGRRRVTLAGAELADRRPADLLALDDALRSLASFDPLKASIVELRFFGGLTIGETAGHLGVSTATVERHWHLARVWLYAELAGGETPGE